MLRAAIFFDRFFIQSVQIFLFSNKFQKSEGEAHEAAEGKDIESTKCVNSLILLNYLTVQFKTNCSECCHYQALQMSHSAQNSRKSNRYT